MSRSTQNTMLMAYPDDAFIVNKDNFDDLEIRPGPDGKFYYFYDSRNNRLIKEFVLADKQSVRYVCRVHLIKKEEKFSPRLDFSVRSKKDKSIQEIPFESTESILSLKANVSLTDCHQEFWSLISFLESITDVDIPQGSFSLVSQEVGDIVAALKSRDTESIKSIITALGSSAKVRLSPTEINLLLRRRERLAEFEEALKSKSDDESWWQEFFEENKWIFGYGLNYQILRQEQSQPHFGGIKVDRKGGQRGDYLTATQGDLNFTVLVEIKTPGTPLLTGTKEVRTGVWSLSRPLMDAVAQIQGNAYTWEHDGSKTDENRDRFDTEQVYTVLPKGIIVIGRLNELDSRAKRNTFQRFRRSIAGIEIITFDELYKRAKYIVDSSEEDPEIPEAVDVPIAATPAPTLDDIYGSKK